MNVDEAMEVGAAKKNYQHLGLNHSEVACWVLHDEVERLRAELAAAKAASVVPVEVYTCFGFGLGQVVVECQSEAEAELFSIWLRERMKERNEK